MSNERNPHSNNEQNRLSLYTRRIDELRQFSEKLGSVDGPKQLQKIDIAGLELIRRIHRIGHIREQIMTKTIPTLRRNRQVLDDKLNQQPLVPKEIPIDPETRTIEIPEFDIFSRADLAMIATTYRLNQHYIDQMIEASNLPPLDPAVLREIIELVEEQPVNVLRKMTRDQADDFITRYRLKAFNKVKELFSQPDYNSRLDEIFNQDTNVWLMIASLHELETIISEATGEEGFLLIEQMIKDPMHVTFQKDNRTQRLGSIRLESTFSNPNWIDSIINKIKENQENKHPQSTQLEPERNNPQNLPAVEAEPTQPLTQEELLARFIQNNTPQTSEQTTSEQFHHNGLDKGKFGARFKILEQRDPNIKNTITQLYFANKDLNEFKQSASPGSLTRVHPRLTQRVLDTMIEKDYLPHDDSNGRFRLNLQAVITALYINTAQYLHHQPRELKKIKDYVAQVIEENEQDEHKG